MGAGAFFLLLIVVILAVVLGGAFFALRAGLWKAETDPEQDQVREVTDPDPSDRFERRPEHVEVDDPGRQRYVGT